MQYRLNEINRIKKFFFFEICEKEAMSKTFSKYIAAFAYFDNTLLVLSATSFSFLLFHLLLLLVH